jgi:Holliday junction resolvase
LVRSGRARGFRAERDLVAKLWARGFAVMRAPASGSKIRKAAYPDVVAIRKGCVAVFEVKSRSKEEAIYIEKEQVDKLVEFASRAGGKAYVAVKVAGSDWVFVPVEILEATASGYKVSREALMKGLNIEQLEVDIGLRETLDRYIKPNRS